MKTYPVLKHHAMRTYWGVEVYLHAFGTRGRWVVSYTPRQLYPRRKMPRYQLDRDWVGLRAGLDAVAKRKIPLLHPPGIQLRSTAHSLVCIRTEE